MTASSITPEPAPRTALDAPVGPRSPRVGTERPPGGSEGPQNGTQSPDGIRRLDCAEKCEIPSGVNLTEVPRPRHAWSDVLNCPNDDCERSFITSPDVTEEPKA